MAPKKDGKKQVKALIIKAAVRPDNSGIPKQDVEFKFSFSINSEEQQPPNFVVMFEWFGVTSDKLQRSDSGLIESWQKSDNKYAFDKNFDPIRVDDDFCKTLCSKKFYVYFVNADDNKVEDMLLLDYSSLLMSRGQNDQPNVMDIDRFSMSVSADKQLLQETYRHFLNPFQVQVIGAKDTPIDTMSKYQPTYVKYSFFDGPPVTTNSVVGSGMLLWSHKHVFLAGSMDAADLKQKIRSKYMKFELHDRDQVNNTQTKPEIPLFDVTKAIEEEMAKEKPVEEDPKKKGAKKEEKKEPPKKDVKKDAKKKDVKLGQPILPQQVETLKNNYGIAAFYLIDFTKPSMRTANYKAPVVPRNTFQDFQSRNIDLNTTARNQMQKIISTNNYFQLDTKLVVGFTLSFPLGTFVKPQIKEQVVEDPKKKKDGKAAIQIENPVQEQSKKPHEPQDVYERVVYILPYKAAQSIQKIQNIFYQTNQAAFKLDNRRQLTTYLLKPEQSNDRSLDYITGMQIIDPEARLYILEGLRQGAMKKLHTIMGKSSLNSKTSKILKNSNITFLRRLYTDFNIDIKRIRLRPSLSQILLDPHIYIKSKVAEEICQNLNKLNDIKKLCDDLRTLDSMNLWPQSEWLIQIERKYSQSLSYEDIHGSEQPQKPKIKNATLQDTRSEKNRTIKFLEQSELKFVQTANADFALPRITQNLNQTQQYNQTYSSTKRHVQTKTFVKDNQKLIDTFSMKLKKGQVADDQPVYIYAGQKNNWYEKQMREMREKIQKDPNAVYTYSNSYLSLSIDPRAVDDQQKKEKQFEKTKMYAQKPFSSLIIKTYDERMKLPKKPYDQDINDLKNHPYHEQKQRQKEMVRNTRDQPILNTEGHQFKKYIGKQEYFSQPEVIEGEKVTPAERFRMQQQQKKKRDMEFKAKLKGDSVIRVKKGAYSDKVTGIDRFSDIRQGSPNKQGIIDFHKKQKQKRPIENYEVSLFLKEERINPAINPLVRVDQSQRNIEQLEFNNYQRPQILTYTKISKPLRKN